MTERYLLSDPPTLNEIERTNDTLNRELLAVKEVLPTDTAQTFIGLAGSVTTIAAMALGLDSYDAAAIHGTTLSRDQVEVITEQLVAMSRADRARLGFMHPGRVDVIGGGALVLREAMRALDLERVLVSEHDLLDGVVLHLTRES
jgi:exopolyphosphatase/guanosine-5'-triphosphate,3'-diphosphate pyrophosphatase